jgi:hypothetical protein
VIYIPSILLFINGGYCGASASPPAWFSDAWVRRLQFAAVSDLDPAHPIPMQMWQR